MSDVAGICDFFFCEALFCHCQKGLSWFKQTAFCFAFVKILALLRS